ncbi:MAG TPA: N-methyl-L-tryptophan oxidase [Chitinophagaceae bacterium]|nr:N-methyl-L-tryptophan oxidase [Chitinophagaceae bacterium]
MITYDHIIIGVGSMGSAACYHLARRGKSVLGLEQFTIPHELGSHAGETRIIRKAYFEHPDYIPLLIRAYENWQELMERSGMQLFHKTGLFYAAPKDHELIRNIKRSAALYNIPLETNRPSAFALPADYESLFEPDAGFVEPENTIRTFVHHAIEFGAEIHEREQVLGWSVMPEEGHSFVIVRTNIAEYRCRKLIITAGAWSAKMIPGIDKHLKVTRQVLAWLKPAELEQFTEEKFPCWLIATENSDGAYYGFPVIPSHPGGLKLAYHYPGEGTEADQVNREVDAADTENLRLFARRFLPQGGGEIESTKVCLYSNSPDENFVIDNLPGMEEHVCVAWGFSGHGFKFVPVVGEILADLAMYHKTALPISFLSAKRPF